jgi:hypothetical protein
LIFYLQDDKIKIAAKTDKNFFIQYKMGCKKLNCPFVFSKNKVIKRTNKAYRRIVGWSNKSVSM